MKKIILITLVVGLTASVSFANYSMVTCTAETGTTIQVYLNGKLANQKPNEMVRLKSNDGCNSIFVIVYDESQRTSITVQRDIDIEPGYEIFFQVMSNDCGAWLGIVQRYPLLNTYSYSKKLYARQLIS